MCRCRVLSVQLRRIVLKQVADIASIVQFPCSIEEHESWVISGLASAHKRNLIERLDRLLNQVFTVDELKPLDVPFLVNRFLMTMESNVGARVPRQYCTRLMERVRLYRYVQAAGVAHSIPCFDLSQNKRCVVTRKDFVFVFCHALKNAAIVR